MDEFVHKTWGTKPAHNRARVRPVCRWCGAKDNLVKDKRRAFGVAGICNKCHTAKYRDSEARARAQARYKENRRRDRGYIVVDGGGILQDGAFLYWKDVHSVNGSGVPDGTIIKRISTGIVYEVWNKPVLTEIKAT